MENIPKEVEEDTQLDEPEDDNDDSGEGNRQEEVIDATVNQEPGNNNKDVTTYVLENMTDMLESESPTQKDVEVVASKNPEISEVLNNVSDNNTI